MFDPNKLELRRKKNLNNILNSDFHRLICTDIIDRLKQIEKKFHEILIINQTISHILIPSLEKEFTNCNITISNYLDDTDHPLNKFDLVIFPLGLHWINDIQKFLYKASQTLHQNGILMCNFPGGGTLRNLRVKLIEAESEHSTKHTPHISPFIQFEQVVPLLQHAGFQENIVDMEKIELEYSSPLSLMKALQKSGESNALKECVKYSITKEIYNSLKQNDKTIFTDQINLISFVSSKTKKTIKTKYSHL